MNGLLPEYVAAVRHVAMFIFGRMTGSIVER
jgi:hypothetical protein